jgi:hypothetical protein
MFRPDCPLSSNLSVSTGQRQSHHIKLLVTFNLKLYKLLQYSLKCCWNDGHLLEVTHPIVHKYNQ